MKKYFIVAFLISSVFLVVNLRTRTFFEPDECRYVEVTREMGQSGNLIVPTYNREPYSQKPPLFFWLLLLSWNSLGEAGAVSTLLPGMVFSMLALLLTWKLAARFGKEEESPAILLVLASSLLFFIMSRTIRMDIILLFWVLLGIYAVISRERTWTGISWKVIFGLALAGGLMTKGPVILIWIYGVPAVTFLFERDKKSLKELFNPISLLLGTGLFACWLVPALLTGGDAYRNELLFAQNVSRVVSSEDHKEPLTYYLVTLPAAALPFTFLALLGMIHLWRERKKYLFLYVWVFFPLLLFSLFSGKLIIYLLPVLPALAIFTLESTRSRAYSLVLGVTGFFFASMGFAAHSAAHRFSIGHNPFLWILPLAGAILACLTGVRFRRAGIVILSLVTLSWLAFPLYSSAVSHFGQDTTYSIAEDLVRLYPNESSYACFRELRPSYLWVTNKPFRVLMDFHELEEFGRDNPGRPFLINKQRVDMLPKKLMKSFSIVAEQKVRRDTYWVMVASPESP